MISLASQQLQSQFRPHPEERSEAARLEGRGRPILRDALLRNAPQDEAFLFCRIENTPIRRWRADLPFQGEVTS
jgi:hypothetical protein